MVLREANAWICPSSVRLCAGLQDINSIFSRLGRTISTRSVWSKDCPPT